MELFFTANYQLHTCMFILGCLVKVNVRVLREGLELLSANGFRFEMNQLLFADDTALVADLGEKLCRLVSLVECASEESCELM